jgi:hypothetical protein
MLCLVVIGIELNPIDRPSELDRMTLCDTPCRCCRSALHLGPPGQLQGRIPSAVCVERNWSACLTCERACRCSINQLTQLSSHKHNPMVLLMTLAQHSSGTLIAISLLQCSVHRSPTTTGSFASCAQEQCQERLMAHARTVFFFLHSLLLHCSRVYFSSPVSGHCWGGRADSSCHQEERSLSI